MGQRQRRVLVVARDSVGARGGDEGDEGLGVPDSGRWDRAS